MYRTYQVPRSPGAFEVENAQKSGREFIQALIDVAGSDINAAVKEKNIPDAKTPTYTTEGVLPVCFFKCSHGHFVGYAIHQFVWFEILRETSCKPAGQYLIHMCSTWIYVMFVPRVVCLKAVLNWKWTRVFSRAQQAPLFLNPLSARVFSIVVHAVYRSYISLSSVSQENWSVLICLLTDPFDIWHVCSPFPWLSHDKILIRKKKKVTPISKCIWRPRKQKELCTTEFK